MTDADTLSILVFVLCLAASMFFSSSETAITSFGDRRARRLEEEGGREGKVLGWWVARPVEVLTTILLGNNVVNTLMGATATALALRHLESTRYASWAVPAAVVVTTGLLLVFGEIVPKALGKLYSHRFTVPILRILGVVRWMTAPLVWLFAKMTDLVIRRATASSEENGHSRVTSGEIGYLVKIAEREGTIPAEQAELLQQVFRFEQKIVRDIMVPLDRVVGVDLEWDVDKIKRVAHATGHSRLPVYEGDLDNIRGILHIKQIVGLELGERATESNKYEIIEGLLRPPFFVSESLLIHDLLRRFKEQRVHLAIVVDDAGDTVGVVTLEDVIEQLVGQIFDESDRAPLFAPLDSGVKYVDGQASLQSVEEMLNVEFEEFDGVASVGDLLTRLAGQMPIAGSVFVVEGVRFKVLAGDVTRLIRISVERVELEDADDED
jgi:putative hemolysin